jgi:hypothetical protein
MSVSIEHRVLILGFLAITLLILFGSGVYAANNNFSQIIPPNGNNVYINSTYTIANQNATPFMEWIFEVSLGITLFLTSCILSTRDDSKEIDAMISAMSTLPLFVAAFTSTSIDMVTSFGGGPGIVMVNNTPTWILMENHTIYHFDITGIVLWVFSMIAVVNTIRIFMNHRRIDSINALGGAYDDQRR